MLVSNGFISFDESWIIPKAAGLCAELWVRYDNSLYYTQSIVIYINTEMNESI